MHAGERHHITLGVLYSLATSMVASTAAAVVKMLSADISPWLIVWAQYGICTLMMMPWLLRNGLPGLRSDHYGLHLIRATGGWLGFTTYYLAIPMIPLVDASLLRAAAPLWIPLIVWVGLGQRVPAARWVALLTGFIGICIILRPQPGATHFGHLLGAAAGLSLAISMAYTRALSRSEPASRVLFYYFGFSFLASTPMAIVHWSPIPTSLWLGLGYVGGSIFLTMVLYTRAYSYAPTTIVAPLGYIAVPLAAIIDWIFWGHIPGIWVIIGSSIVISSGVLAVTLGNRQQSEH
ncbi:MAG: DMT family transporter [Alcanivoracaceae bacterium]|nr:DMT family transporter [Alcanivoracaceae bacterium]